MYTLITQYGLGGLLILALCLMYLGVSIMKEESRKNPTGTFKIVKPAESLNPEEWIRQFQQAVFAEVDAVMAQEMQWEHQYPALRKQPPLVLTRNTILVDDDYHGFWS